MPYNLEKIEQRLKELNLPLGKYILVGGSALAAHGIREAKDLDIVVIPELFENLIRSGWTLDEVYQSKWNRKRLTKEDVEIYPDLYLEKANVFLNIKKVIVEAEMINEFPFQKLEHLKICKLDSGREKDLIDVDLIEKFLDSEDIVKFKPS
jgi:hypothetical protein